MFITKYTSSQVHHTNNQPKEAAGSLPNAAGRLPDDPKARLGHSRPRIVEQCELELGLRAAEGPGDEPRARKRRQESVTLYEGNGRELGGSNPPEAKSADEGNPSISPAGKEISKGKGTGQKEVPASFAIRCKTTFYRGDWGFGGLFSQNSWHDSVTPSTHPPSGPPLGPNLAGNKKAYLKKHHEHKSSDARSNPESNLSQLGANHE
jgi:hypothetical protein